MSEINIYKIIEIISIDGELVLFILALIHFTVIAVKKGGKIWK